MRLTEKDFQFRPEDIIRLSSVEVAGIYNKLRRSEDIEDELGMPLAAYHRVMKSMYCGADCGAGPGKAFYRKGGEIRKAWILQVDYCKKKVLLGDPRAENDEAVFMLSGYGDTWALSEGELRSE